MITSLLATVLRVTDGPARQNAFGSLLIQASQRLSRFVVVVAAAALLHPSAFASVAVALALTDLVRGGLQAFDVDAVRLLSRGDNSARVIHLSLDAKALTGTVGLAVFLALSVSAYDAGTAWLVLISGIGTLAASFGSSFLVLHQAALALRPMSLKVVTASLIGTAISVLLTWLSHSALWVVVGLAAADALLLAVVGGEYAWRRPDWRAALAQVKGSRRLLVMQLAYIGQFRAGTIVLATAGATIAVAEYTIASRIAEGLVILATAVTASSLPLIGAAHARNEDPGWTVVFARSYRAGISIATPCVALLVIAAPIWIGTVFPRYPDIGVPLGIVGLAVIIFFGSSQTTALLNATHRDRAASRSAVAGVTVSVLGSVFLVPLGAAGAAWARVAGELVRFAVEAAASIRELAIGPGLLVRPWLELTPILIGTTIAVAGNWKPPYVWLAIFLVIAGTVMLLARLTQTRPQSLDRST